MSPLNPIIFTKIGARLASKTITIAPKGSFLFSSGLVHQDNLQQYSHCILGYDLAAKAICFQFTNEKNPGSIKIAHRKAGNIALQSGSFFAFNKIDPKQLAGRYPVKKETIPDRGEWLVVYLSEKGLKE
jgi:hypothetical protein